MSPPREIELKLEVPAQDVARLGRSTLLKRAAVAARKPATLVSVYFDTDKLKLRKRGFSLRVRRVGRRHVQTIKQDQPDNTALLARNEWERNIGDSRPDLDAARDTALKPLLSKKLRRNLKPVFETRVRRKVYLIKRGDTEIELAIDKGTIEAGKRSSPLCEVELELKQGEPAELFKLARALGEDVPVQLAVSSKAERGYALVAGEEPAAVKAVPVALTPDRSRQAAFQVIARSCLRQLVANQPAVERQDAEGLHQMRVALRRLRAAISLFADILVDPETETMKSECRWIAGELGPARELDVFIKRVLKPVADGKPNGMGVAVLGKDLWNRREDAFARARAAVVSARFRSLVVATAAWIEAGDWTRNADDLARALRGQPVAAAATALRRRWKKVLKRGARIAALDAEERHNLRIQAKKLRYASEFFAGAFPGRKAARRRELFLAALEKLQDALGDLNDIAVHEELTEHLVDGHDAGDGQGSGRANEAFAAGRLAGREEARTASVLKDAERAHHALAEAKPFWR